MKTQNGEIKKWMQYECLNTVRRDELNSTLLAEQAADHFNLYENEIDYPIPEWVFEMSQEVIDWWDHSTPSTEQQ